MADGPSVVDVSEYTTALKRRWPLIGLAAFIGAVLGLLLVGLQSSSYESIARVEVRPLLVSGDAPNLDLDRQINMKTEQSIGSSQRVAERAATLREASDELGISDLDDPELVARADELTPNPDEVAALRGTVEAESIFDSHILEFAAAAAKPSRAQQKAESMAYAYLDFRIEAAESATVAPLISLGEREATLYTELDEIAADIGRAGGDEAKIRALTNRETAKREELIAIGSKLANLNAITVDPGEVLDDADLPTEKTGVPTIAGPVGGLLFGLFVGLALAFLFDRSDDRVRDPATELASLGLPMLGTVPVGRGVFLRGGDSAIASVDEDAAEQYRRVQSSLLFNLDQTDKSVILVTGPNNPHSATTVAANLAVAGARAGRRTLIIGADLRRPSLHDRFDATNNRGLSDVLTGEAKLANSLQSVPGVPNLRLLSAGTEVDQPASLLQSEILGRLVASVRSEFDLVIFEAPPVLQVADAVDLARFCEGAVLVIEPSRATRSGVIDSVEQLRRVGAEVVGTVVAAASVS